MSSCVREEKPCIEPKCDKVQPPSPVQENMRVFSRLFRFSPLGPKSENQVPKVPKEEEPAQTYYGVYIPCESKVGEDEETLHVYTDKADALKIVKKYKKARFKAHKTMQDAVAFSLSDVDPTMDRTINHSHGDVVLGVEAIPGSPLPVSFLNGEKPSQFKGPKPQEMVSFRKLIETGDYETVKKMIWDNPRYLISSGDTPSILQEGSRYNALHVGVKANNVQMCDLLLATISDPHFFQLLFGDENIENSKSRASILLDLYLNMPDKAMNETPLHFAVKFGNKDIVDLLVSYPQCSRTALNKFKEQPKDIICQRSKTTDASLVKEIAFMLRDKFYVPVLHSEDNTRQPIIGEPFSPGSPPTLNSDPISPRLEIRAYAGPMDKEDAVSFRKKWKTPPRSGSITSSKQPLAAPRFRLKDVDKGLERVGRNLAQEMKIGWKEYWPFLDTFTDLTSEEGLELFEEYLKNKYDEQWRHSSNSLNFPDSFQPSPKTPVEEKSFSSKLTASPVEKFIDTGLSPMSDLCLQLKSCTLVDSGNQFKSNCIKQKNNPEVKRCPTVPEDETLVNPFLNPGLSPYLCVEKSCQVFAKRIGLGLTHSLATETEVIIDCFKSETKHLQQTVASYMDDPRFCTVDFHLVHSRVAQLIAQKLISDVKYNDDLDSLKASLKEISQLSEKKDDAYSSDEDEAVILTYRTNKDTKDAANKKDKSGLGQIKCMASSILNWLTNSNMDFVNKALKTEEESIEVWSDLCKCHCPWQTEAFFRNCRKNASLKRSQIKNRDGCDILSSSPKSGIDFVSRRLKFESDAAAENGQEKDSPFSSSPKSDRNHNFSSSNKSSPKTSNVQKKVDSEPKLKNDLNIPQQVEDAVVSNEEYNSDNDEFLTPISTPSPTFESSSESDYEDVENEKQTLKEEGIDAYIHGEKPSKIDKAAYDAISNSEIDLKKFPYVYRWRHTIGLYTTEERESWLTVDPESPDDVDTPISCSFHLGHISHFSTSTPSKGIRNIYSFSNDNNIQGDRNFSLSSPKYNGTVFNPIALLTPRSANLSFGKDSRLDATPSMQVSKWMRVTGPNSPRSAFVNKNFRPNVSFGF